MSRRAKFTAYFTYNDKEIEDAETLEGVISHGIYNLDGIIAWRFETVSDEQLTYEEYETEEDE